MKTVRHVQSPFMNAPGASPAAKRPVIFLVLAIAVAAVFLYAGALKVWDPGKFARDIQNFKIVPWAIAIRLAFYLPWLEILCGLALITGWLRAGAVALLTGLTVIFIGATIAAKARGIDLDCGCFGSVGKNLTFTWHLVIDFAILAALVVLWYMPAGFRAPKV